MLKVASQPSDTPSKSPETAERSAIVQSANWKEQMLLQKKLHILNRSEKNLVHRIAIDQKVLFKRFQMKRHRSKLAYADIMGEKEKVMELRGLHLHDLNTNCGQNESDYAFLAKLEYRPCTADGPSGPSPLPRPNSKGLRQKSDGLNRQVMKEKHPPIIRSMSASGRYTSITGDREYPDIRRRFAPPSTLPLRPATAAGTQIEKEYHVLPDLTGDNVDDKMQSFVAQMSRIGTSSAADTAAKVSRGRQSRVSFANLPSDTSGNYPASTGSSRRGSSEGRSSKKSQARRGSIFEEVKKLNVLELWLSEAKSVDHVPKVKEFCESMKDYENSCQDLDYYPQKMQAEVEQAKKDPLSIPGTPDSENYKFIGNTKVKSLTMPLLNLNFAEEKNQCREEGTPRTGEDWESFNTGPIESSVENISQDIET